MDLQHQIQDYNNDSIQRHQQQAEYSRQMLQLENKQWNDLINQISHLQVAVPSWALGTGGTRFGRFPGGG